MNKKDSKLNSYLGWFFNSIGLLILIFILSNALSLDVLRVENLKFQIAFFSVFFLLFCY